MEKYVVLGFVVGVMVLGVAFLVCACIVLEGKQDKTKDDEAQLEYLREWRTKHRK